MTLYGIDISNHQGAFDLAAARREDFVFATAKVSEADYYADPLWERNRDLLREHFDGRFGGYHYYRRSVDPQRQADLLLTHLGDPTIPVQLDFEDDSADCTIDDLWAILDAIDERGLRVFATYLPRWYWSGHMGSPSLLGTPPLWASNYVTGTGYASELYPGDVSPAWSSYGGMDPAILQFSSTGVVAGQLIDVNAFRGNGNALDLLFAGPQRTL